MQLMPIVKPFLLRAGILAAVLVVSGCASKMMKSPDEYYKSQQIDGSRLSTDVLVDQQGNFASTSFTQMPSGLASSDDLIEYYGERGQALTYYQFRLNEWFNANAELAESSDLVLSKAVSNLKQGHWLNLQLQLPKAPEPSIKHLAFVIPQNQVALAQQGIIERGLLNYLRALPATTNISFYTQSGWQQATSEQWLAKGATYFAPAHTSASDAIAQAKSLNNLDQLVVIGNDLAADYYSYSGEKELTSFDITLIGLLNDDWYDDAGLHKMAVDYAADYHAVDGISAFNAALYSVARTAIEDLQVTLKFAAPSEGQVLDHQMQLSFNQPEHSRFYSQQIVNLNWHLNKLNVQQIEVSFKVGGRLVTKTYTLAQIAEHNKAERQLWLSAYMHLIRQYPLSSAELAELKAQLYQQPSRFSKLLLNVL